MTGNLTTTTVLVPAGFDNCINNLGRFVDSDIEPYCFHVWFRMVGTIWKNIAHSCD